MSGIKNEPVIKSEQERPEIQINNRPAPPPPLPPNVNNIQENNNQDVPVPPPVPELPFGRDIPVPEAGRREQLHTLLRRNAETTDHLLNGRLVELMDRQMRVLELLERRLQE